ncbi:MAG TPA: alpha/beta fold hydrolase [Galbitalea sp.]
MPNWTRAFATAVDGSRLAWFTRGQGSVLLLIAGQSVDHRSWALAAPTLERDHTLIAFDHRGIGESEAGAADRFTTRLLAEDAIAVLDATAVTSADVLGHSMGGRIAQWLVIDYADRVRRLVLVSTSAGDAHGPTREADLDAALRSSDLGAISRLFFDDAHAEELKPLLSIGEDVTNRARHFRASRHHDALAELPGTTTPTLVLHGSEDRLAPVANAELLAAAIPGAQLEIVPGGRHGIVLDGGPGVDAVARFLS